MRHDPFERDTNILDTLYNKVYTAPSPCDIMFPLPNSFGSQLFWRSCLSHSINILETIYLPQDSGYAYLVPRFVWR